jgi:hypothetical protein
LSHASQFNGSVFKFLQTPLQQVSPAAHGIPQPPQFCSSVFVFTHIKVPDSTQHVSSAVHDIGQPLQLGSPIGINSALLVKLQYWHE